MRHAALLPYLSVAPLCLLALLGCTQATINRSASDIVSSVILQGDPSAGSAGPVSGPPAAPAARRVLGTAEQYLGTRYTWGGSTPNEGFDCSGYVKYVYGKQGVRLPRTSREQAKAGQSVRARVSSLRAGDLMMFAESRKPISHVAIYAGGGRIIHSSSSGGGVRYDDLVTRRGQWFVQHMVAARRLAVDGRSLVQSLELISQPGLPFDPPDGAPPPKGGVR
jgi:cell wall-associated NlpC family hydrolase